jgi:DNA-directed RNA polymerase subunit RPC12/RpoP
MRNANENKTFPSGPPPSLAVRSRAAFQRRRTSDFLIEGAMDDSIQITCSTCKASFRDYAGRLHNGYERECPRCNVLIFFDTESSDLEMNRALTNASRVRNTIAE